MATENDRGKTGHSRGSILSLVQLQCDKIGSADSHRVFFSVAICVFSAAPAYRQAGLWANCMKGSSFICRIKIQIRGGAYSIEHQMKQRSS
jgi:hypothetical protein